MCGIAGAVNFGTGDAIRRMVDIQAHRGPDDSGVWGRELPDGTTIALGSRRLAILDLSSAGHMPMQNADGSLWITYNGEIYNFQELRSELQAKGCRFRTNTDTEVVLQLYEQSGPECVKRLNGIFAFAIADLREPAPKLFVARDHFGVKPFYYFHSGPRMAFASEAKALFELPGLDPEIETSMLPRFLALLWVPEPDTIFRGIRKLPAGHYGIWRDGELKLTNYWDLTFPAAGAQFSHDEAALAENVREQLRRSVKRQMISDVPLGAFLSAGMDSSSIVSLMTEASNRPVRTYTITFPREFRIGESALDDPDVASRIAGHFGCEHQEIVVEPGAASLLPRLVWHMDEPVADPAIITAYLVCREARKTVTVLLSGIGGDELFAGYRKHYADLWAAGYARIPGIVRRRGVEPIVRQLPSMRGTPFKGPVRLTKKMVRSGSLPARERYLMNCTYLDEVQRAALYSPALRDSLQGCDPYVEHERHFAQVSHAEFLNQMLYVDTKAFMVSLNLNYNDKMSMASSLEVRVPFLDRELAEFAAWNVPPGMKLRGFLRPKTKYILRKAMAPLLPAEVLQQKKAGFGAPVDYWLAGELREMVDDLLSESRVRERGYFDPAAVRRIVSEQRTGRDDRSMVIWQLLTFELWLQAFTDHRTSSSLDYSGAASSGHRC